MWFLLFLIVRKQKGGRVGCRIRGTFVSLYPFLGLGESG
jgi:hypothetical protein